MTDDTRAPAAASTSPGRPWRLTVEPDGITVNVRPGQSLLEAALATGLDLPRSCRNGTCRACRAERVDGQVRYRVEWPGLTREERAEGWTLPCVAEPASDVVLRRRE
jgi:ferredoxin